MHCNCCGKEIRVKKDIAVEGMASLNIKWGYFSEKDGETHKFNICEKCYDKMISEFIIPVEVIQDTELV